MKATKPKSLFAKAAKFALAALLVGALAFTGCSSGDDDDDDGNGGGSEPSPTEPSNPTNPGGDDEGEDLDEDKDYPYTLSKEFFNYAELTSTDNKAYKVTTSDGKEKLLAYRYSADTDSTVKIENGALVFTANNSRSLYMTDGIDGVVGTGGEYKISFDAKFSGVPTMDAKHMQLALLSVVPSGYNTQNVDASAQFQEVWLNSNNNRYNVAYLFALTYNGDASQKKWRLGDFDSGTELTNFKQGDQYHFDIVLAYADGKPTVKALISAADGTSVYDGDLELPDEMGGSYVPKALYLRGDRGNNSWTIDNLVIRSKTDVVTISETAIETEAGASLEVAANGTLKLNARVKAEKSEEAVTPTYKWELADDSYAMISGADNGASVTITGKNSTVDNQTVRVNLTVSADAVTKQVSETFTVKANDALINLSLDKTAETVISGATLDLTATAALTGYDDEEKKPKITYTWESSDQAKATVAQDKTDENKATVTTNAATEEGNPVVITVTAKAGDAQKTATCKLTITENTNPLTGVSISGANIPLLFGITDSITLTATAEPAGVSGVTYEWTVSGAVVEIVGASDGKTVTLKSTLEEEPGVPQTATVNVTAKQGTITYTGIATVTVRKPEWVIQYEEDFEDTDISTVANAQHSGLVYQRDKEDNDTVKSFNVLRLLDGKLSWDTSAGPSGDGDKYRYYTDEALNTRFTAHGGLRGLWLLPAITMTLTDGDVYVVEFDAMMHDGSTLYLVADPTTIEGSPSNSEPKNYVASFAPKYQNSTNSIEINGENYNGPMRDRELHYKLTITYASEGASKVDYVITYPTSIGTNDLIGSMDSKSGGKLTGIKLLQAASTTSTIDNVVVKKAQ